MIGFALIYALTCLYTLGVVLVYYFVTTKNKNIKFNNDVTSKILKKQILFFLMLFIMEIPHVLLTLSRKKSFLDFF